MFLQPESESLKLLKQLSWSMFKDAKKLYFSIDETLIKKIFSLCMQGTGKHYDTLSGRCITAYKMILGSITDGKNSLPFSIDYLFPKELIETMDQKPPSKEEIVQSMVRSVRELFPNIIIVADGLFATKTFLQFCHENGIAAEVRLPKGRKVMYKGESCKVSELIEIKGVKPKGRQMARTISVVWHEIPLEVTIVRRIDRHGEETVVYQAATYKALPIDHVRNYDMRWSIEKIFRTGKSYLGLLFFNEI